MNTFGRVSEVAQIDLALAMGHDEHLPTAVRGGRSKGDALPAEGLGQAEPAAVEATPAALWDGAHLVVWGRRARAAGRRRRAGWGGSGWLGRRGAATLGVRNGQSGLWNGTDWRDEEFLRRDS